MDFDQWLRAVSKGMSLPSEESSVSPGGFSKMEKDSREFDEEVLSGAQEEGD